MRNRIFLSAVLAVLLAGASGAHHNMSALFDFGQRFTRTGTLSKIDWRNPHIYVFVDVRNEQGQVETWSYEGPPPGFFRTRDIGKADFENSMNKPVTIEASRARDGSRSGLIREIHLADGKTVSACPQNC